MATDCDTLGLGMGPVLPPNSFNSIPHPGSVGTPPQRRPPFPSPFPYTTNGPGCRPAGPCLTLPPFSLPSHRPLFPWSPNVPVGPGEFYKPPPSAFTYYPRAVVAAAMAAVAATADKRTTPDEAKSGEGLDLTVSNVFKRSQQDKSDIIIDKNGNFSGEKGCFILKENDKKK